MKLVTCKNVEGTILKDEERYTSDGSLYATYDASTFIWMFEVSFGWEKR